MTDKYDDIIDLPRPVSKTHAPMSLLSRAAQFAAFAAVGGHSDAIAEKAIETEQEMNRTDTVDF